MGKYELYIIIAVFVVLTVIIVWMGAKTIGEMRNQKKNREVRRQEWLARIRNQRESNG